MNSLWVAMHQPGPETVALSFGTSAQEAADLIAEQFPKERIFMVGRVEAGTCYSTEDALLDRHTARRGAAGELQLRPLLKGETFWTAFE